MSESTDFLFLLFSSTATSFISVGSNVSSIGFHGLHVLKTLTSVSVRSQLTSKRVGVGACRGAAMGELEDLLCVGTGCLLQCGVRMLQSRAHREVHFIKGRMKSA